MIRLYGRHPDARSPCRQHAVGLQHTERPRPIALNTPHQHPPRRVESCGDRSLPHQDRGSTASTSCRSRPPQPSHHPARRRRGAGPASRRSPVRAFGTCRPGAPEVRRLHGIPPGCRVRPQPAPGTAQTAPSSPRGGHAHTSAQLHKGGSHDNSEELKAADFLRPCKLGGCPCSSDLRWRIHAASRHEDSGMPSGRTEASAPATPRPADDMAGESLPTDGGRRT
jgi:hypothetical protein